MPLAEYLASEQAREDVKALLAGRTDCRPCGEDLALVLGAEYPGGFRLIAILDGQTNESIVSAYYRPDGDRYVVTDLGEGVRALRLRTGEVMAGWENWFDGVMESVAGVIRIRFVTAADLPDAICRVMLASLRVAQS